ncbi:hypothetical protein SteCoe_34439 [Stentor coeruleus]|uniref:POLO box domain-containing protein n=1 Tax=Stentor coeruleus TaxID=5963 RepID=A0A1R2AUJ4_9CILI|nr:hypothetical protein SteCoe_34439 [Stentor coeruleus]
MPETTTSALTCPSADSYLKQFVPETTTSASDSIKLTETTPSLPRNAAGEVKDEYTDRPDTNEEIDKEFQSRISIASSEIWIKKWVDYSNKYGLGYTLSNGATGVFFNDSTKIVISVAGQKFRYYEKKEAETKDTCSTYLFSDYPKKLKKKIYLLQHFKNYLEGDVKQEAEKVEQGDNFNENTIYVKKWMRTRHLIMFKLSNKITQVSFQDHTEMILSPESRMITYINKKGERSTCTVTNAFQSTNLEMTKRLKYVYQILLNIVNSPTQQENNLSHN